MKVLIIGSGGREHAIAYALNKSSKVTEIHAMPGNPGIAEIGTCHPGNIEDINSVLEFVETYDIDFTVIGPEVPLCLGLADLLEDHGHKVFGPRKIASNLEGSKIFSKNFMMKHNIPTAKYVEVDSFDNACNNLKQFDYPVVIKADGLAAGKGVIICEDENSAREALKSLMIDGALAGAGKKVIIEEFLQGFECSLLCFTDGESIIPMVSAKDHKQIYDGNVGPNTGGMGTVSPNPFLPDGIEEVFSRDILKPFLLGLKKDNIDYRGVIFIGLMIKDNAAKVLEFNVRFGDPETQSILLRLKTDLFDIMSAVSSKTLKNIKIEWLEDHVACLVLASGGYPNSYKKGMIINGLSDVDDVIVFHAGTAVKDGNIVTNGGRVLNICAYGKTLEETREKVYKAAEVIDFEGKYYRKDIGLI